MTEITGHLRRPAEPNREGLRQPLSPPEADRGGGRPRAGLATSYRSSEIVMRSA